MLYIDLDTVIAGSLDDVADYSGPFAALSVAGMANERRCTGINSSVMSWDAGEKATVAAVYSVLQEGYSVVRVTLFEKLVLSSVIDRGGIVPCFRVFLQ